ncbi:calpain-1 catalytic subunit-like, partial [Plectropomus leopardus]|uniref:calpain-1 catalytic subunit-like n=1 Tax=Plectropomus leopardus TaxID=160734 RepID=UPI001C4D632A
MFSGVCSQIQKDRLRASGVGSVQQAIHYLNQDFQALKQDCLQNRSLFQDPMFPAEPASLGFKELAPFTAKTRGVEWKRPTELTESPQFIVGGATRTDICQGALGPTLGPERGGEEVGIRGAEVSEGVYGWSRSAREGVPGALK